MVEQPVNPNISSVVKSKPETVKGILQEHKALFIFLLAVSVVIIGILLSGIGRSKTLTSQKSDKTSSSVVRDIKSNYFLNKATNTKDPKKAADYYKKAYFTLTADYDLNPSSEKREDLKNLGDLIKDKFPDEARNMNFVVPCWEESCGAVYSYSKGLAELKTMIEDNKKLDKETKEVLLIKLKASALASGKKDSKDQADTLTSAYITLKTFSLLTQDASIKLLADKAWILSKEINPDQEIPDIQVKKL